MADDGAALVQEVLQDNPAEERGVRDEWDNHVGWNRKEYIGVLPPPRIRGGTTARSATKNVTSTGRNSASHPNTISTTGSIIPDDASLPWLWLPLCGLAMLMVYLVGRFFLKTSNKTRTS